MITTKGYWTKVRRRMHRLAPLMFALPLAVSLSCVDDYNPFVDMSNAGIHVVSQTAGNGDTVSIFSAETLQVIVTLKEHVDQLVVSASDNRTWESDTQVTAERFSTEPFSFAFSFHDTGRQWVSLTTYGGAGVLSTDTFRFQAISPLHQDTVEGFYSNPVELSTPPVGDRGVRYVWSFGAGENIESDTADTIVSVLTASPTGEGELWVTDGVYHSPRVPFRFVLNDTTPPTIQCVNTGYAGGDTVYTGSSSFVFKVAVEDDGGRTVDSVSCNGVPFDEAGVNGNGYYRLFTGLERNDAANPFMAVVHAVDDVARFRNATSRTFYIVYNDTLPAVPDVRLVLSFPDEAVTVTGNRTAQLIGTIEKNIADTLHTIVEIQAADSVTADTLVLATNTTPWYRTVTLVEGTNNLSIRLLDTTRTDTLQVIERTLAYAPGLIDTVPPVILDVIVYDRRASGGTAIVRASRVFARVSVGDAAGAISSVLFNGVPSIRSNQSWYYSDTLLIEHSLEGTDVVIQVADESGNVAEKTVTVYFNRAPVFERVPSSSYLWVDSSYTSVVTAIDPDGDEVVFSKHNGPSDLVVTESGDIRWTPTAASLGSHTIRLRAFDGYQSEYYVYNIYVGDSGQPATPVRFETLEEDFPRFLQADWDTLEMQLRVRPGAGIAPFYYSARIPGSESILLNESRDSVLRWTPTVGDTGYRQLIVVVRDNIASSDTIYPRIFVVPTNRPCSLSVSYGSPTTADGAVDLNARQGTDTLVFRVSDPDPREVERHTVTVHQARAQVTSVIDSMVSDSLRVTVSPWVFDGHDTVTVVVSDIGGNIDTLVQTVYYGMPPGAPTLLAPADGANGVSVPTVFQWQGSDPDGDTLSYELYVGTAPESLTLQATTDGTEETIGGLSPGTTYYWKVRARDWKSDSSSTVFSFRTQ